MDPGDLVGGVLRSVLGGRRKRSTRTVRYLSRGVGGVTRAALSHPTALLTLAGVAWGIVESLQGTSATASDGGTQGARAPAAAGTPMLAVGAATGSTQPFDEAARIVKLVVSAALADGALSEIERAAVLDRARAAGVEGAVARELSHPSPLPLIVAGVRGDAERATLYGLAVSIVRADEQIGGAERIYLAQLAHLLALDPAAVQAIERTVASRIDATDAGHASDS